MEEEKVSVINNEFDYSNSLPTIECITYLVQYCFGVYKQFIALIEEDYKQNEQFRAEYRNYQYKRKYSEGFRIYIRLKTYNNLTCKDFDSFKTAVDAGNLTNISNMEIKFDLDYQRGKANELVDHENSFSIIIKPFDFVFARKSSHNEQNMNQIENNINEILKKFPTINTIFCTKN